MAGSDSSVRLRLAEEILDFIRGNLQNIERTWGADSPQYRATREIMQQYWDKNAEDLKSDNIGINLDIKLEDLLANMSLMEKNSPKENRDVKMS